MNDTGFNPPQALLPRIAPTERCAELDAWPCKRPDAPPLRGVVHDPTARRMGGVAGHAGLFSTARDLQRFARMLLNGGRSDGVRVLSAGHRARDDVAVDAARHDRGSRPRLGHRYAVLDQSRRPVSDRLVRSHRLHRHEHLGRSGFRRLRDLSVEPSASRRRPAMSTPLRARASRPSPPPHFGGRRPLEPSP